MDARFSTSELNLIALYLFRVQKSKDFDRKIEDMSLRSVPFP